MGLREPCPLPWKSHKLSKIHKSGILRYFFFSTLARKNIFDKNSHPVWNMYSFWIQFFSKLSEEEPMEIGWLCWGLTSQSTIFQSCRDGAIASWVINQYFRGVKCLAQGHNTAEVGLEPRTSRSGVRHSTTEPPRSPPMEINPTKNLIKKKDHSYDDFQFNSALINLND